MKYICQMYFIYTFFLEVQTRYTSSVLFFLRSTYKVYLISTKIACSIYYYINYNYINYIDIIAYMYTNVSEETKVLTNKLAFAHENNQSNKKSKQGDAWIKFKQREKFRQFLLLNL